MISRRRFINRSALTGAALYTTGPLSIFRAKEDDYSYESDYLKVGLSDTSPAFSSFSTDSLGKRQFAVNPLLSEGQSFTQEYENRKTTGSIRYFIKGAAIQPPAWEVQPQGKTILFHTAWKSGPVADAFTIPFSQPANHCTVLGEMTGEGHIKFPCLLHLPGMGTLRIYCSDPAINLVYDADRNTKTPFVKLALPAADSHHPAIAYRFESVAIYPAIAAIKGDKRFDGFRKNYINIFQVNPRIRALANNSASDACAFTLFLYAEMARHTPVLVEGLTAMQLVRDTLNRYLGDMKGYGQKGYAGWRSDFDSLDSSPSLIISACYYIMDTKDHPWAKANYPGIKAWAEKMMAADTNGDGIVEYGYSGNSGSWDGSKRPSNWWDAVGFGHDDGYSNILVYHALKLLSEQAQTLGQPEDAHTFRSFAEKLRGNYFSHFYNGQTGVLAGWKSADGQLHDYYFVFLNSMAVCYDLVDAEQGRKIMTTMLIKMKEVGYTDFRLGLPGNLIPVNGDDYSDKNKRWGFGGADGFQIYENGGATGCYAYYTIHALYKLGMKKEAEQILFPMLESYKTGGFDGHCETGGMSKDWKTWKGECWGYEGFLVDNYLTFLAVFDYAVADKQPFAKIQ